MLRSPAAPAGQVPDLAAADAVAALPGTPRKRKRTLPVLPAWTALCLAAAWTSGPALPAEAPPPDFKVAFLGDQGLGAPSEALLKRVKDEGADLLVHLGDFDYQNDPAAWEAQTDRILGADFPQVAVMGNHDIYAWSGAQGYAQLIRARMERMGIAVEGEAGVQCAFRYRGIFFIMTAPGLAPGAHADFIRRQLQADSSAWRISAWHVNQARMQAGLKGDEAGWGVYEESRAGGAIIATAHEHSYSRTHLLSSMADQKVASRSGPLRLRKGRTFAFVSGLGGSGEIRPQSLEGHWWASIYTATQGADHGALFGSFNVDGDERKARFYFKTVGGRIIDSFEVFSELDKIDPPPVIPPPPPPGRPRRLELDPEVLGLPSGADVRLVDIHGRTVATVRGLKGPQTLYLDRSGILFLRSESGGKRLLRKVAVLP